MSEDTKSDVSAKAAIAQKDNDRIRNSRDLSDADLDSVTGGVKPWLDPGREPDTAIFYTVERKL
ncbi:hypothetical protein W911_08125 [Hyphomicrobium nitrativorans NL23]|uniref:Uncharacterized protein n=1 Tax=Hyphomicrobium nitrativorans NL23 TaxID=1029756 RepID=V5SJG9_9HYPH|nr:hypothetical protein [Hyphomicrobium nitrativorans]AHB50104.1 hypothetical protein W911_08125 [Hyphomicrobium nitrativorans NL23]